jgi:predicted amidohydrolase
MGGMRVAVLQMSSGTDSTANRQAVSRAFSALEAELDDGLDLVVLPEATMHDFGAADHDLASAAEPLDGPFVGLLAEQASRIGATVVAGMFERTDGLPFNTLVAVRPDGDLAAVYRKIHLYDSFGYRESDRLAGGPLEPVVLDVADLRLGLMTCYDLRFPELGRALVDAGALGFVVPSAWVAGPSKVHHWRTLVAARAIENTVIVVAAAQNGEHYCGHSMIVDAAGSMVEEAGGGDAVLRADLTATAISDVRDANPSLLNRRMSMS